MYKEDFLAIFWVVLGVIIFLAVIIVPCYYGSCRQAEMYNEKNKTEYTCGDFFWASEQINQTTQTIKLEGNEIK